MKIRILNAPSGHNSEVRPARAMALVASGVARPAMDSHGREIPGAIEMVTYRRLDHRNALAQATRGMGGMARLDQIKGLPMINPVAIITRTTRGPRKPSDSRVAFTAALATANQARRNREAETANQARFSLSPRAQRNGATAPQAR